MEYNYKTELLLQAIFPSYNPPYIIKENFIGQKSLRETIEKILLSAI